MAKNLEYLRQVKISFGFIFTLTLFNLDELAWVAQFAREQGARLLQVHPLEEEGRAGSELHGAAPDELEIAHAFIEVARLQKMYSGQPQSSSMQPTGTPWRLIRRAALPLSLRPTPMSFRWQPWWLPWYWSTMALWSPSSMASRATFRLLTPSYRISTVKFRAGSAPVIPGSCSYVRGCMSNILIPPTSNIRFSTASVLLRSSQKQLVQIL